MDFLIFIYSENFFHCSEPLSCPEFSEFRSIRGRLLILSQLFKTLLILPLACVCKLSRTVLSLLGIFWSVIGLILTLCHSLAVRKCFFKKMHKLTKDLADWILWPIGVTFYLGRLLVAAIIHPAVYFHI